MFFVDFVHLSPSSIFKRINSVYASRLIFKIIREIFRGYPEWGEIVLGSPFNNVQ